MSAQIFYARVSGQLDDILLAKDAFADAGWATGPRLSWDTVRQVWVLGLHLSAMSDDHASIMIDDWTAGLDVTVDMVRPTRAVAL